MSAGAGVLGAEALAASLQLRLDALQGVRTAIHRLAELGPVSEIVEHGPAEAAAALDVDRVLLSRVDDGALVADALFVAGDPAAAAVTLARLQEQRVRIDYPLVEGEVLRRRRPRLVEAADAESGSPTRQAFADVMGWGAYLVAPIVLEARVIGFFHADRDLARPDRRPLDEVERDALGDLADGFALVFERAILRRRLRIQRQEMRQVASWADARTSELSDRAVTLATDREPVADDDLTRGGTMADSALRDLLTRRELDVLELMVKGETNGGIARALVVSEGTVKFHVKNILRKLHASNRAEATSRYLRLTLRRGEGPPTP